MDHPIRDQASLSSIRSSHREFANQILNCPIEIWPPASFSTSRERLSRNSIEVRLDSTDAMRNLFDGLSLIDKAATEAYTRVCLWFADSKAPNHPPGTISVILRFVSPGRDIAFDVHACISPDCVIQGSGMFDPKAIHLGRRAKIVPPPVINDAPESRGLRLVWQSDDVPSHQHDSEH